MQFTTQQLSGGPKYGSKTKIGNWSEERARVELEAKDFELRKSKGALATTHKAKQRAIGYQTVPHSYADDGLVRYTDTVQLRITHTDPVTEATSSAFLASNIWDRVSFDKNTISVTAIPYEAPVARNTFVITKPYVKSGAKTGEKGRLGTSTAAVAASLRRTAAAGGSGGGGSDDGVLKYGDRFFLATNPSLRIDERTGMVAAPYLLTSEIPNTVAGSGKGAAIQDVVMTLQPSSATEWKILPVSGDELAFNGLPVKAGEPVVILHAVTNQALNATAGVTQVTDFGPELDITCATAKPTAIAAPDKRRAALEPNRWSFVLASDPAAAVDTRDLKALTPEALVAKVRDIVNARGNYGIRGLGRAFRIMDDRGDGKLDKEDFKWGLYDYGVHLNDEEFDLVLSAFDRNGDGTIDFTEFLVTLRGPINERRLTLIREAFRRLDKDGSGVVTLSDLEAVYSTKFHPEVIAGKLTHAQAVTQFMSQWDTKDKDGIISFDEFEEYYKDVSASIDDDDYFELMMRNAWHISGGEGWSENTTCKRVLVIHTDDSEEIVEIKDDLGFDATNIPATRARLEAQGVRNIKAVKLSE